MSKNEENIENVTNLTQSEVDRINMKEISKQNLFGFFNDLLDKTKKESELFTTVKDEILNRVKNPEEKIATSNLLKLFEILAHNQTQSEANILNLAREPLKVESERDADQLPGVSQESTFSPEDLDKAKNAIKYIDSLRDKVKEIDESE
jgi:hypothetical protein